MQPQTVAAARISGTGYPDAPPFHPASPFPETPFPAAPAGDNPAYAAVRECFRLADLDSGRYGTARWNPLGELVSPGETVLLKPNLVKATHPRDPNGWRYLMTHGSIIRAAADYVYLALGGQGKVMVADACHTDSPFSEIRRVAGLDGLSDFYRAQGLDFAVLDLRREEWESRQGVITKRSKLTGDPQGYTAYDLGAYSEFANHGGAGHYYGADYDTGEVNRHHSQGRHEYLIAASAMGADVVFSLPKLKTHKKAGITAGLKNLVGINGDKNWLPHHTESGAGAAGDERPGGGPEARGERAFVRLCGRLSLRVPVAGPWIHQRARAAGRHIYGDTDSVVRSGNWWGNDTVWRMCLDLNKILLYGDPGGWLRPPDRRYRKRHYVLVDGILAGEGRGPLDPDSVAAGMVVFGCNAPGVDAVCARLMGFDPERIPIIREAFGSRAYALTEGNWQDIRVASNHRAWNGALGGIADQSTFHFVPHFGWRGHIEYVVAQREEACPC